MKKSLVLAEKPSVGRDIARVLNCRTNGNGFIEGSKYIVTWALGHLVTLADPEEYSERYKEWKLEDLPMLPEKMKLVVIKQTSGQYKTVKTLLNRDDVSEIIIATDAGREGELVARWIIEKAGARKPIKRLWISSVTDKAILEGFNNLKDGNLYRGLYNSAVSRSEADWIIGINATRALTCKHNAQLSCGRVQTPTLSFIAQRENEIKTFVPQTFYGATATANGVRFTWVDEKNQARSFNRDRVQEVINSCKGKPANVSDISRTLKKRYAPQLYDLTELQRDANKLYNFSANETLSFLQSLYERHKVLTYPRTDSRYISKDIVPTLKDRIAACGVSAHQKFARVLLNSPIRTSSSFVDDAKVTDHHAIIPTEQPVMLSEFSASERKIYDLVIKRFLAALYPPFEYEQSLIKLKVGKESFIAKGKIVKSLGFMEIYSNEPEEDDDEEIKEQTLPSLSVGQSLTLSSITETTGQTRPPSPFTEATLLSAMENPVKYMQNADKSLAKTLGETGGLGTVATRGDIIEKLLNSFLIEKRGRELFLTSKGRQLLELVPAELKSPELTARWEQKLSAIAKNSLDSREFIGEMREYTKTLIRQISGSTQTYKHENLTMERCPQCKKFMLEVKGKKGVMLICQDRDCGYRVGVSVQSNARCPQCHKRLELKGQGQDKTFVCKCGYREKLSAFNERRSQDNDKANKHQVARLMKEINKDEKPPVNNAIAKALEGLKL